MIINSFPCLDHFTNIIAISKVTLIVKSVRETNLLMPHPNVPQKECANSTNVTITWDKDNLY